jgi:uncharacterized protein YcbK (DUF882 family)
MTNVRTTRRRFFQHSAGLAAGLLPIARSARASAADARTLSLVHTHTNERIALTYAVAGSYRSEALAALNRFLRDHYSGDIGTIDPALFDQLYQLQRLFGESRPFEVISGYRCPTTNARLRATRGGGVASRSLHLEGRAIDIRAPGVPLSDLRDAAISLRAGGVGFYSSSQFVHLDTGRVRRW